MIRFALLRAFAVLAFVFCATLAWAQQAPLVGIDPIRAALDQIETQVRRGGLGIRALYDLQQQLGPLRDDLRVKLVDLEPRLTDVETRLQGLGSAPAAGASENAAIAAERERLTQLRDQLDAAARQARLLQLRADQLAQLLSERRRTAYAETLFERSPSVLDPSFWREVFAAIPDTATGIVFPIYREGWLHAYNKGGPVRLAIALVVLTVFAAGMSALASVLNRRLAPRVEGGVRFSPAVASLLVFIRASVVMPFVTFVAVEFLNQMGLLSKPLAHIGSELVVGVTFAALGRATALAVFAPDEPERRLLRIGASAQPFARHLIWGARALGLLVFILGTQKTVGVPHVISTAVSTVFSILIFILLVHLLFETRPSHEELEAAPRGRSLWARPIAWAAVVAITVALLTGYVGLATFVAGRIIFTVILLGALYLLLKVLDRLIDVTMSPQSPRSRVVAANLGLDPRGLGLIGTVLSGAVRVLFLLIALALVIGPWEIAAADFLETMRVAIFGVRVGDIRISFGAVFGALVIFAIVVVLTRVVQRWLETRLLPGTALEPSLQLSIVTVFGYVGYIIALVAAMAEVGIDPQKIALVAGALSVGIGFGLQSIVSNFVSGLILLAERPIRVGDQIVVKGDEGFVRRISVRATEIETFDRASVIIPNSELITGVVKNWTHANTLGRLNIKVSVSYDCDADKVMETLKTCIAAHPEVLKQPPAAVQLTEFGSSAIIFEIFCIVPNLIERGRIKSEIHVAILREFRAAGIDMTPPQDVRLVGASVSSDPKIS